MAPEACDRKLQVIERRIRFDPALSFKRMENKSAAPEPPLLKTQ